MRRNTSVKDSHSVGVVGVLAFAGDLSMGQPPDHSPRTALLSIRLLCAIGYDAHAATAARLALLRWSGCTANAAEFDDLFGDDVAGRAALISGQNPFMNDRQPGPDAGPQIRTLSRTHCETGVAIIERLGLRDQTLQGAFLHLFEGWDGSGLPNGLAGDAVAIEAQAVSVASDLEVWARIHGLPKALSMLECTAGQRHDPRVVACVLRHGADWLANISRLDAWNEAAIGAELSAMDGINPDRDANLLSDYADLKLPLLDRPGRRAAELLRKSGAHPATIRAGLLHGLGWVSVPNRVCRSFDPTDDRIDERCRLVPHWTARCLSRHPSFGAEASRALRAYEKADGSGFPSGISRKDTSDEEAMLQAAVYAVRAPDGIASLRNSAENGICAQAADRLLSSVGVTKLLPDRSDFLSPREHEVLVSVAHGLSNKQIARELNISPSTVGTHVENLYRKLGVSNRATATLKALEKGLLG
ncbi:MAG: winged helix-turn-helix transcriptional regulator [Tabrizicola sp.]|nr:winged helix-turn-helix transcriptional regulator [Tabrizicola sp.]